MMESSKAAEDALSQERRRIMSGLKATTFTPSELDELNQRPEKIKAWLENNDLNSVFLAIVRATSKENRQATIIPLQDKLMRYIAGHTQEIVDLDIKRVRKIADTPGQTTHEYPVATPESIIKTMMIYHPMSAPHQIEGASLPKMLPSYKDLLTTIYPKQSERPIQVTNVIKAINNWSMDINTAFAAAAKFQNEFLRAEIPHNVLRVKESPLQTVVTLQANIASVEDMLPKKTLEGIFSDIDRTPTTTISEKDKSLLKGKLTDYVATNLGQIQTRAKAKLDELAGGKEYSIDSSTKHWRDQDEVFRVLSSNHPIHTPQQALTTQEIKGMLASYKELVETIYANNSDKRNQLLSNSAMNPIIANLLSKHEIPRSKPMLEAKEMDAFKDLLTTQYPNSQERPRKISEAIQLIDTIKAIPKPTQPMFTMLSGSVRDFSEQTTCETKLDAIAQNITSTKWELGFGGGTKTKIDNTHSMRLPKTMSNIIDRINAEKAKGDQANWKTALTDVEKMLPKENERTILSKLSGRHQTTQDYYNQIKKEISAIRNDGQENKEEVSASSLKPIP